MTTPENKCVAWNCLNPQIPGGYYCNEHGCRECGDVIFVDSEKDERPLCYDCWIDASKFDVVFPFLDQTKDPGMRLHLYHADGQLTVFAEEQVLPEKVTDPNANRVIETKCIPMTQREVRWLHEQLTELVKRLDPKND